MSMNKHFLKTTGEIQKSSKSTNEAKPRLPKTIQPRRN